jgi:hypothetical protein
VIFLFFPLGMGMVALCNCMLEVHNLLLNFIGVQS